MGKITVKHELNNKIGGINGSPIYVRVRYQEKTTRFKSLWPFFFQSTKIGIDRESELKELGEYFTTKEFDNLQNVHPEIYKAVDAEAKSIHDLINYFVSKHSINIIGFNISDVLLTLFSAIGDFLPTEIRHNFYEGLFQLADEKKDKNFTLLVTCINWDNPINDILMALESISKDNKYETDFYKRILKPLTEQKEYLLALETYNPSVRYMNFQWLTDPQFKSDLSSYLLKGIGKKKGADLIKKIDNHVDMDLKRLLFNIAFESRKKPSLAAKSK